MMTEPLTVPGLELTSEQAFNLAAAIEAEGRERVEIGERQLKQARALRAYARALQLPTPRSPGSIGPQQGLSKNVVEVIRENPGVSPSEVAKILDHNPASINTTVLRLYNTGRVIRTSRGQYEVAPTELSDA
jgi:hypothetical protein